MREYSIGISQGLDPVLPPEQIERLTAAGQMTRFERGAFLYRQGEPAEKVYLLVSGRANTFLVSSKGQEALLRFTCPAVSSACRHSRTGRSAMVRSLPSRRARPFPSTVAASGR